MLDEEGAEMRRKELEQRVIDTLAARLEKRNGGTTQADCGPDQGDMDGNGQTGTRKAAGGPPEEELQPSKRRRVEGKLLQISKLKASVQTLSSLQGPYLF